MFGQTKSKKSVVFAFASGKGGVGKTVIAANLAVCLAETVSSLGLKIIVVDLDFGCGNLNACLNVRNPGKSINDFIDGRILHLDHAVEQTAIENLGLISSSYRGSELLEIDADMRKQIIEEIYSLPADFVLLDLGSGASTVVLDLFNCADERIVVITPEATSLHNAYLLMKSSLYRLLFRKMQEDAGLSPFSDRLSEIVLTNDVLPLRDVLRELNEWNRVSSYVVSGLAQEVDFKLILNMSRNESDQKYRIRFCELVKKYLDPAGKIEFLGSVCFDKNIKKSIQTLQSFQLEYPESRAAKNIEIINRNLLTKKEQRL